jgi:hypothetical protein
MCMYVYIHTYAHKHNTHAQTQKRAMAAAAAERRRVTHEKRGKPKFHSAPPAEEVGIGQPVHQLDGKGDVEENS